MKTLLTRILIVEDNADDEALLMRQLTKADLHKQVKVINDGRKALEYLCDERQQSEHLVAVFLDFHLPNQTGLQILTAMRAHERIKHLPVILMTSSNEPNELDCCRALGISSFVVKPITFSSFAKAVADTFHLRRT